MRFMRKENAALRLAVLTAALALFCLLRPMDRAHPRNSVRHDPSEQTSIATANFAVADFDGDRKPDLATVEMERGASTGDARYSIRFQLATGNTQVFGVTAPAGGLQIVARDVNGDNVLDLLVSTQWQHQQVAVFLNDGHGNFTPARPDAYPVALSDVANRWESEPLRCEDGAALLRFPSCIQGAPEQGRSSLAPRQVGLAEPDDFRRRSALFLFSLLGRAPPRGHSPSVNTVFISV